MSVNTYQLRIYRKNEEGVRIPWVIVLDHERTVLDERIDEVALARMQSAAAWYPDGGGQEQPKKNLMRGGQDAREFRAKVAFWVTKDADNPFPGTDELRNAYFDEVTRLEESFKTRGKVCPSCEKGRVIRNYTSRLSKLLGLS